jgi:ADP-heptose:LPS heptosyltransferase
VLVLRPGALGDTLLAVPALRALHSACTPLTLAAHASAARLLASIGEIDTGVGFDDSSLAWLFHEGRPIDESVVAWMAEPPRGLPAGSLLAPSRPPGMDRHCALYLLETLAPMGIDLTWDAHVLDIVPDRTHEVLVHPGSGSPSKNLPSERLAAAVRTLKEPVRLIVGEADHESATSLEQSLGYALDRLEHPSLEVLAARLAGCRAYLGNDSGVSHLAGLCGAHAVVMFGPSDPTVWRPIGPDVHVMGFEAEPSEVVARLEER